MMRALGYPRLISLENFRQPNFRLVSEMLSWLVKRFEPNADLPSDIDTEQDRVIFIRSIVQFMATKAHIKLHTKKLYQSDGYAVKEVLKVTSVLYNAMRINSSSQDSTAKEDNVSALPTFDISSKLSELKMTRQLGSQITLKGAALYDLLGKEVELREKRNNVLARQLEITEVEQALRSSVRNIDEEIKKITHNIENVASNEANLEAKIEKKKVELDRNQKRLMTLQKVRPAFMDEYEKLEEELKRLYEEYIIKFRCMTYLEQQIDEYERVEQERMEERQLATKKILERMKNDDSIRSLEGSSDLVSDGDDIDSDDEDDELSPPSAVNAKEKPATSQRVPNKNRRTTNVPNGNRRVFGSMTGAPGAEEDSGSLDSDSDLILDGENAASNSDTDDDDEDELEINEMAAESLKNRKSAKPKTAVTNNNSDDDF